MSRKDSTGDSSESVAVAVHIRPLIEQELEQGCAECVHVPSPGSSQVVTGAHDFTYDHVFGGDLGKDSSQLYDECVSPLVNGLFQGYNATVFAYGQTGSGKTYTMGSAFPQMCASEEQGVIPRVMDSIFGRIRSMKDSKEFTVKVGFVEIHKEEIKDLLSARTSKSPLVHIREVPGGGIVLAGAHEVEVTNQEDMIAVLERGTCLRATGATGMNQRSSRSHAIFTITVEQRTLEKDVDSLKEEDSKDLTDDGAETESDDEEGGLDDSYLCAKMHLVDLAGSERVKRTKNEGQRLQEGIKINRGLLALGNVINALSENKQHVPYRDSKLTRMLQDSLGGNSRTLMIACVSPADINLEESLNSLRYASRARAIKNKPVVNRDPIAAQISNLRHQLALARAENADLRRQLGISPTENLQDQHSVEDLQVELESTRTQLSMLTIELGEAKRNNEELKKDLQEQAEEALIAAMQRDKMAKALSTHIGQDKAEQMISDIGASVDADSVEGNLLKKLQNLEEENRRLRAGGGIQSGMHHSLDDMPASPGFREDFEHIEGSSIQQEIDSMNAEMYRLQSDLEAKEAAIRKVTSHASMQVAYKTQLKEIEKERDSLAKERKALLIKIKDLQNASMEERTKLERMYKSKLRDLDLKVKAAEKRERKIRSLEATQQRAAQKVKELEGEVQNIKTQKAVLQRHADKAGKEFTQWKRQRDKEVLKLKKDHQSTTVRLVKLEAQNSRQQAYLRRKIEEAAAARKRLANLEGRRTAARASNKRHLDPAKTNSMPTDVGEWVESELDSCCSSIELQKVLEGEKASRSEVARELRQVEKRIAALKNPKWWGLSPGMNKDQKQLEQLKRSLLEKSEYHGKQIQEIQLSLMQMRAAEEERGQGAADPKRWEGISTIESAHASLVTLFVAASKYKTQAYEFQSSLSELSEEVEMLKLKLEVSEAERLEQLMQMDAMKKAAGTTHQITTPAPRVRSETEDTDVKDVLHELDSVQIVSHEDEGESEVSSSTAEISKELLPGEIAALGHMNTIRAAEGLSPVYTLSKKDLQEKLEGITLSNGNPWRADSKSKAEMISDYLALVVSKTTPSSKARSSPLQSLKTFMRRKQDGKTPQSSPQQQKESPSVIRAIDLESPTSYGSNGISEDEMGDARAVLEISTGTDQAKTSPPKEYTRPRRQTSNGKKKIWIPAS